MVNDNITDEDMCLVDSATTHTILKDKSQFSYLLMQELVKYKWVFTQKRNEKDEIMRTGIDYDWGTTYSGCNYFLILNYLAVHEGHDSETYMKLPKGLKIAWNM